MLEKKKRSAATLLNRLTHIKAHDKLGMERLVKSLNYLDDASAKRVAEEIRKELKKAGIWKGHFLRSEVLMFLENEES